MRASRAVSWANQILHVHFKSTNHNHILEVTISSPLSLFSIIGFKHEVIIAHSKSEKSKRRLVSREIHVMSSRSYITEV